jgi:two-component system, NtrC family, nitrogen regulation sensor histidine kinase NtrY
MQTLIYTFARARPKGERPFRAMVNCSQTFMNQPENSGNLREPKRRRRTAPWLLGTLVLSLLSLLVALQVFGLYQVVPTETASDTLLLYALSSLNFIAFIVFAFIFVRSLLKLRRERRERRLGSKIKTRLVVYFISLSLLPITAMAVFSFLFLNRSLERWFGKLPEEVMAEARQLQEDVVRQQTQALRDAANMIALALREKPELESEQVLAGLLEKGNLDAIEIVTPQGEVLMKSTASLSPADRQELEQSLEAARASKGDNKELTDGRDYDVVVVPINENRHLLVAPPRYRESNSAKTILASRAEYEKLKARQRKVRQLGLSTLGLFTLLQLFGVTWIAIHLGRGFATPIQALAEASNEVASGNLSYRVTTFADDELALLVARFNQMTAQLQENRRRLEANAAEVREKNLALEERRNYIEIVLESLSTGVVSFDSEDRVTTINAAAASMLRLSELPSPGAALSQITSIEDRLVLERLLKRARRMGRASEQTELARGSIPDGLSIPVALTATALHSSTGAGVVLVIEDLSELLAAQRTAAWSEVARRMAHEIKNPLTPIQLSAERIAKNFNRASSGPVNGGAATPHGNGANSALAGEEHERVHRVVEECTATIKREVAGLKAMVDEFSRFARLPHARLEASDLNEVVRQAVNLYEDRLPDMRMDVRLARRLPQAMLDQEQMRRVIVNLIDNALEAVSVVEDERRVTVATAHDPSRGQLLVEVTDTGHGIPREDFPRLFQPYFSTRERGTGLGLAIVQRIMSEHGGRIRAEQNRPRGAKFVIELPATGS